MELRRCRPSVIHVSANLWRVIVLRAWREGSRLRVRVLVDDDCPSRVVDGADAAVALVARLLGGLEADDGTGDGPEDGSPETPRDTPG